MEVIALLHETSSRADSPDTAMGYGIVNLHRAMNLSSYEGNDILAYPNPFSDSIMFELPITYPSGQIKMRIFSAAGKLVFSQDSFGQSMVWNGRNNALKQVANGVYLCWLKTPAAEYTTKIAYMGQD